MKRKLSYYLLGLFLCLSGLVMAADSTLDPICLLEFQDEPSHFFLIGRDSSNYGHRVIESNDGHNVEHALQPRSDRKGNELDLYLADGTRLFVQLGSAIMGSVTYSHRPRETLRNIVISMEKLAHLGLLDQIKPEFFNPPPSRASQEESTVFLKSPQSASLIIVSYKRKQGRRSFISSHSEKGAEMYSLVEAQAPGTVFLLNQSTNAIFEDQLVIACEEPVCDTLAKALSDLGAFEVDIIKNIDTQSSFDFSQDDWKNKVINIFESEGSLSLKMNLVANLARHRNAGDLFSTIEEKNQLIFALRLLLQDLNNIYAKVFETAYWELRKQVRERMTREGSSQGGADIMSKMYAEALPLVPSHGLYEKFGKSIKQVIADSLLLMYRLDTVESRRVVLLGAAAAHGAGLSLMGIARPNTKENYLDYWLGWMRDAINEASSMPAGMNFEQLSEAGWRCSNTSGGIFRELSIAGNLTFWHKTKDSVTAHYKMSDVPANPLVLLGIDSEAKAAKKKILQFIISTDATVYNQLQKENAVAILEDFMKKTGVRGELAPIAEEFWRTGDLADASIDELKVKRGHFFKEMTKEDILGFLRRTRDELRAGNYQVRSRVTGNLVLHEMIQHFTYAESSFRRHPGFSREEYFSNLIDIFKELIETSAISLKNDGTYHATIDASLQLSKELERDSKYNSEKSELLSQKVVDLRLAIQNKFLEAARFLKVGSYACELMLGTNPFQVWRDKGGR